MKLAILEFALVTDPLVANLVQVVVIDWRVDALYVHITQVSTSIHLIELPITYHA